MDKNVNREFIERQLGLEGIELDGVSEEKNQTDNKTGNENKKKNGSANKLDIFDIAQCVISAVVVGIMVFLFVFRVIGVKGDSMYSTLHNGDRVVTSGILYEPKVGDIVILKSDYYDQPLVKRVIATENQTVDIDFTDGVVYVDGEMIEEPYISEPTYVDEGFSGPVTVPDGCLFVMGDNRNE